MQKQPTAGLQNMVFYVLDVAVISLYTQAEAVGIPNLREVNST
jgi:hypothetical protein